MKKALAIMWTVVLGVDILSAIIGMEPNWMLVFGPLVCLVADRWERTFEDR